MCIFYIQGVSTRNLSPIQMLQAIQHAKLRLGYKFSKEDFSEGMSQAAQPGILSRPGDAFLNEPQILKFLSYHSLLPIWYIKSIIVNKTLWAQQIKPWSNSVLRGQKPPLNYNDK